MQDLSAYIESLEDAGEKLTRQEWIDWIKAENADLMAQSENVLPLSDDDIKHIIEKLETDGFIKEA